MDGLNIPPGLEELLPRFIAEMEHDSAAIAALAEGDRRALAEHLHAMCGKCAMFGEERLLALLTQLEAMVAASDTEIGSEIARIAIRIGQLRGYRDEPA